MAFEVFGKEYQLVENGISPICMVVPTGTYGVVMWNLFLQQCLVQCHIAGVEEIIGTTIDGNGLAWFNFVNLAESGALIPSFHVVLLFAKMVFDVPVVWERPEINATT